MNMILQSQTSNKEWSKVKQSGSSLHDWGICILGDRVCVYVYAIMHGCS